ncbi:MAG TPA: hypothetical protein VMP01_06890 [Pirellulaceae bacterium]|nr:hypothetical protein [Pirellulaceae bacterium]
MHCSSRRPILLALAAWLSLAAAPSPATVCADERLPIEIRQVEIGYDGIYKSGFVTPIWLTLSASQDVTGVVEVLAADGDGVPAAFAAAPDGQGGATTFKANEETILRIDAKIGPEKSVLAVQLRDPESGTVLWKERFPDSTPRPIASSAELIVSLGESPALVQAAPLVPRGSEHVVVAAMVTDPARLSDVWWGWEGVRTIVAPIGTGRLAEKLSPQQWKALTQWVELGGGRLVVVVGEGGRELLTDDHPLTSLIPGTLVDVVPLRDLERLNELTGHSLAVTSDAARPRLTQLAPSRGRIELTVTGQREELPLLVRASHGFGEVAFLALDPDGPALAAWPGRGRLLLPALAEEDKNVAAAKTQRRSSRLGYDDLSGQLRMALDAFPRVRVVNFTTVAVLTLAYLALIGPLEFFFLRRFKLPSTVTWFAFPLLVALFCGLGWYAARSAHGTSPLVRQCEIIDIDAERQVVRGTMWLHVYSPETTTYRLSLTCDGGPIGLAGRPEGWLSWQGLPGKGLGGLAANQLAAANMLPYPHALASRQLALDDVPIQIAGSKSLSARWWGTADLPRPLPLSISPFGLLQGEVANPLPVELHDCLLVYDEWMYRLRTLSPGQRLRVDNLQTLNLEARLQQRTVANAKDVISPWEPDAVDVPRIVQMLMFHDSARGSAYTNLAHRYQGYLDLTSRIRNDRAVLVGRLSDPVTKVSLPGAPIDPPGEGNSWTFVRIVLPVSSGPRQQP